MRRHTTVLFLNDQARAHRIMLWCARLGLGFYIQKLMPGYALIHIATREGAEIAHKTSAVPIYTFP